jgi:glycosyltransferase involved in cell wall biosynthesis
MMGLRRTLRMAGKFFRAVRNLGPRHALALVAQRLAPASHAIVDSRPMASARDMVAVDWTNPPLALREPVSVTAGPIDVAWVTSPPSAGSGGHQNMFRFISTLEQAGHRCTVYLYDWQGSTADGPALKKMLQSVSAYPNLEADFVPYQGRVHDSTQALFATAWETAYPVYLDPSRARRFYFVQDFEPWFYPVGDNYVLAENTYRFGFHGLTAGAWLEQKLSTEYAMAADHYDFAADTSRYRVTETHTKNRSGVFFYARPSTPRRAFDLGIAALTEFAKARPDVTIHLAGGRLDPTRVPFAHVNHESLDLAELNPLYNQCSAALVLSLSNMSLLPLELLAAGVTPVVNDAPNNRLVSQNPHIAFAPLSPAVIARRLREIVDAPPNPVTLSASLGGRDWTDAGVQFTTAFERAMRG